MGIGSAITETLEGALDTVKKFRGGYPGGWKKYARGWQGKKPGNLPPFTPPSDPSDRRSLIPPLGLREYWYPALPDKGVGHRPVGLKLCGLDVVFFRGKDGQVKALLDVCPHRGAALSWGECVWKGYLSCPYHGATFDGEGNCVEFITEGPDSQMVGRLQARAFPTVTLKGIVFVWTGEGAAVPPEEDIPPEFFDERTMVQTAWDYWAMNWLVALENTFDAHNCFWVHRNAFMMLRSRTGGRPRTPVGYRTKNVNDKVVKALYGTEQHYFQDGKIPYQMHYPRVDAKWPLHRWRLLWTWFTDGDPSRVSVARPQPGKDTEVHNPDEWGGIGFGQRLPSMRRATLRGGISTRWCVPVEEDLTRLFYINATWPKHRLARFWGAVIWPYRNWLANFNFQSQDRDAVATVRYDSPEFLSATDSYVVAFRKLITDHARGLRRSEEMPEVTTAEGLVQEAEKLLGQSREQR